jgi:DNA-binding NtrC family response regulator
VIRREDLQWLPAARTTAIGPVAVPRPAGGEEPANLKALEDRHIQRVLELAGGNKTRAARLLGISRRTLYRRRQAGQ